MAQIQANMLRASSNVGVMPVKPPTPVKPARKISPIEAMCIAAQKAAAEAAKMHSMQGTLNRILKGQMSAAWEKWQDVYAMQNSQEYHDAKAERRHRQIEPIEEQTAEEETPRQKKQQRIPEESVSLPLQRSYSTLLADEAGLPLDIMKEALTIEGRDESAKPKVLSAAQRIFNSRRVPVPPPQVAPPSPFRSPRHSTSPPHTPTPRCVGAPSHSLPAPVTPSSSRLPRRQALSPRPSPQPSSIKPPRRRTVAHLPASHSYSGRSQMTKELECYDGKAVTRAQLAEQLKALVALSVASKKNLEDRQAQFEQSTIDQKQETAKLEHETKRFKDRIRHLERQLKVEASARAEEGRFALEREIVLNNKLSDSNQEVLDMKEQLKAAPELRTESIDWSKQKYNPDIGSNHFQTIDQDIQEALNDLVDNESLDRIRNDYQRLHVALQKSHESEKRLLKKCREISAENAVNVQTALKLSLDGQNTNASLKQEVENAWEMEGELLGELEDTRQKVREAEDTIQELKTVISSLELNQLLQQQDPLPTLDSPLGSEHSLASWISEQNGRE